MLYNYHTHTRFCGHAQGETRAYVEKAIAHDIQTLGFSDHAPYAFPDDRPIKGMRMRCDEIGDYARRIRDLQKEYAADIRILLGFETEYYPDFYEEERALLQSVQPDFLLLGQHFLGDESFRYHVMNQSSDDFVLLAYVTQVIAALNTGDFLYVAHPDIPGLNFSEEAIEREYRRLCVHAKKRGVPLEINLLGLRDGRHYPQRKFFQIAADVGNDVVLGVDAHSPEAFDDESAEKAARQMASKLGLHLLEKPIL